MNNITSNLPFAGTLSELQQESRILCENHAFCSWQEGDHEHYDAFYTDSDFKYHPWSDPSFIRGLIKKFGIKADSSILDVGCGTGWYSSLFARNGLKVTGVDLSSAGIQQAKKQYGSKITWIEGDACSLDYYEKFDIVFVSSFSPLMMSESLKSPEVLYIGKKLVSYLKNEGLLIFIWFSDLSEELTGYLMNYSINQIREYFLSFPNVHILSLFTTHSQLFPLLGQYALSNVVTRITSLGLKIHHKNVRIICTLKKLQSNL